MPKGKGRTAGVNNAYANRYSVEQVNAMRSDPKTKATVNIHEGAPVVGISEKKLRILASKGLVPGARKIGNQWRFNTHMLIAWALGEDL